MPHSISSFTSRGLGAHIYYSSYIILDKTVGRVICKTVRIFIKKFIKSIVLNWVVIIVYLYMFIVFLSIYSVTYGPDTFSVNYMCIIVIEPKQTMASLGPA